VNHYIDIASDNSLEISPNRINTNIGDRITFYFYNGNHTLTQSSLERPCVSSEQFDSGFTRTRTDKLNKQDLSIIFMVNTLAPQWFFCR